jgi:hypothetical protein
MTLNAASGGGQVIVVTGNDVVESSWDWSPGYVYVGSAAGALTQTPPTVGSVFLIGVTAGPARLRITPQLIAKL